MLVKTDSLFSDSLVHNVYCVRERKKKSEKITNIRDNCSISGNPALFFGPNSMSANRLRMADGPRFQATPALKPEIRKHWPYL